MKIEQIATDKLIPYARNAKRHDAAQVSKLAGSIREFGFNNPVLIDKDNGIVAGHGRVMAAQKLELKTVPCIRLGHLTDTQRRAYILADNRLAEIGGGWDEEMLRNEINDLIAEKSPIDLLGWSDIELEDLLNAEKIIDEAEKEILHEQSLQVEPGKEYILIIAQNEQEWSEMVQTLQLKKVRRGGYKEGSAFDSIGTERVLTLERIKNAYCNTK
jgi:ParB-like chromosome segregation protein Spo0J